jgi:hypothetical protein
MTEGGFLLYKCRRCGEVRKNIHAPYCLIALSHINTKGITPKEWGMQMGITDIHCCADGNLGISDLIGAVLDKKEESNG